LAGGVARGRRGIASIEFGMIMAAIVVIVLGTYDVGNYALQQMNLAEAANVGGQYPVSYRTDTAGMTTTVDNAVPPAWISDVTVTGPSMSCTCGSAGIGDAATCSVPCPSGIARFMTVTLQRNDTPLLVVGLTSTSASYVARIQ
jgi:Flp pilus assembly protein TadG